MLGVAKAPKLWTFRNHPVFIPRFFALPDHPYPRLTSWSLRGKAASVEKHLNGWKPDAIVCHTLWPVGVLAHHLAQRWNIPWVAMIHGYDFDVALEQKGLAPRVKALATACDALVCASERLTRKAQSWEYPPSRVTTIPCMTDIDAEWKRPVRPMKKKWKKEPIDILFPADPRRPEKRHLLALQTGEELEQRGWVVGVTSLRHQPRNIVYDRMLTADVTLITSKREAGPLVARESLLCGTPVVSVDVGEVNEYLPDAWVCEPTPSALADGIEDALRHGWTNERKVSEALAFADRATVKAAWSELLATLVE